MHFSGLNTVKRPEINAKNTVAAVELWKLAGRYIFARSRGVKKVATTLLLFPLSEVERQASSLSLHAFLLIANSCLLFLP